MTSSDDVGRSAVVPAIETAGSLATIRSLGRRGVHTIAVSERERPPSFSSRYCDETRAVPSPTTDLHGYRDALLALADRADVDAIVPMREADIHVLAKHRDEFAERLRTPWPTAEQLAVVHDRVRLFDAAERAGVPIPETRLLDDIDEWGRERIVKARHAILTADTVDTVPDGHCVSPPKTIFLEPGVEPDVDDIAAEMGHVPVAQSYVDGTEYCLRALYRDGEPVVTSQKKLIRGYKYSRGPSIYHEAVSVPDLEAAGLALLDELEWEGLASVGFIADESGTFNLLEINPRVPASLPADVHAGVDYPVHYWDLCRRTAETPAPDYRPGTASHLLRGELVHLHSVAFEDYALAERPSLPGTVWDIATSLVEQPRFDILDFDDPAPFARDVLNTARDFASE